MVSTYEFEPISSAIWSSALPDDEWLSRTAAEVILGDPKSTSDLPRDCPPIEDGPILTIPDPNWQEELLSVEHSLLRDSRVRLGLAPGVTSATAIARILADNKLGNTKNRTLIDLQALERVIQQAQATKAPLLFVLPAFPFKNRNIFRCGTDASRVELGEIALIIRLWALAVIIAEVHAFGAKWVVASDGIVYHEAFGVPIDEAIRYRDTLRRWRSRLGMDETLEILELSDLVGAMPGFVDLRGGIQDRLRLVAKADGSLRERIAVLARGMKKRINLTPYVEAHGPICTWRALNEGVSDAELADDEAELRKELEEESSEAALKYLSFNVAVKWVGLYQRFFPDSIRATVHPKQGQVAVPRLGGADPWSGVTICRNWARGECLWHLAEIVPRWDLQKVAGGQVFDVRIDGTNSSFFRATMRQDGSSH